MQLLSSLQALLLLFFAGNNSTSQHNATIESIHTHRGGVGTGIGGTYGPQELLQIYGLVTLKIRPVANLDVLFSLQNSNGTIIAIGEGLTNQTGIANVGYRLPAPDPNATEIVFGAWTITGSLNLSQGYSDQHHILYL